MKSQRIMGMTIVVVLLSTHMTFASVTLGQLAIVGYQDDLPDEFSIVALDTIAALETFYFVDARVNGGAVISTGNLWQVDVNAAITPGTAISISDIGSDWAVTGGNLTLTGLTSGVYSNGASTASFGPSDSLLLFDSTDGAMLTANSTNLFYVRGPGDTDTPTGLTDGSGITAAPTGVNRYTATNTGTAASLFSDISDDSNWTAYSAAAGLTSNNGTGPNAFNVSTVPEPGAFLFLSLVGLGVVVWKRSGIAAL